MNFLVSPSCMASPTNQAQIVSNVTSQLVCWGWPACVACCCVACYCVAIGLLALPAIALPAIALPLVPLRCLLLRCLLLRCHWSPCVAYHNLGQKDIQWQRALPTNRFCSAGVLAGCRWDAPGRCACGFTAVAMVDTSRDFAICAYAHTRVHSGISAAQKPARTAEIRRGGIPRGSIIGNCPGFPAHAQAARGLKIGVDYVLTRARA